MAGDTSGELCIARIHKYMNSVCPESMGFSGQCRVAQIQSQIALNQGDATRGEEHGANVLTT
jgi:hypothetical protein